MTREEAIAYLEQADTTVYKKIKTKTAEALEMAIKALEQQPYEDYMRELIREFDNKHPALFSDYMREFNNHPISEIIEYMWDMHHLIQLKKYYMRLRRDTESEDEE